MSKNRGKKGTLSKSLDCLSEPVNTTRRSTRSRGGTIDIKAETIVLERGKKVVAIKRNHEQWKKQGVLPDRNKMKIRCPK